MRKEMFLLLLFLAFSFSLNVILVPLNSWQWNAAGDKSWRLFNPSGNLTYSNNITFGWNATSGIISFCDPDDCTPVSMQQTTSETCQTPVCQAEDMYGGNCTSTCTLETSCTPPPTSTCSPSLNSPPHQFSYSCQPPPCISTSSECTSICTILGYCTPLPDANDCSQIMCYPEAENDPSVPNTCNGMGAVVCPPCYPGATGCKSVCHKLNSNNTCISKTCKLTCDYCPSNEDPPNQYSSSCSSICWNGTQGQDGSVTCISQLCTRTTHICTSMCTNRDNCTMQCSAPPSAHYVLTVDGAEQWAGDITGPVNRLFVYGNCTEQNDKCLPNCMEHTWQLDVYDNNGHNIFGPYTFKIYNEPKIELITSPTLEMTETNAMIDLDFKWKVTSCGGIDVNCTITIEGTQNDVTCTSGEECSFNKQFDGSDICSHPWTVTCTDEVGQTASASGVFYITMDSCRPNLSDYVSDNSRCKMSRSQTGLTSTCYDISGKNNITLDCNGHEISGTRTSGVSGITISGGQNNIIDNCNIHDFESAVKISSSKNSQVNGSKLHDNLLYGVELDSNNGAWVNNTNVYNNLKYGVYIHGTGSGGTDRASVYDNPTGIQVQDSALGYVQSTSVYNSKTGVNFVTSSAGSSVTYSLSLDFSSSLPSSIYNNDYGINLTNNPGSSITASVYNNKYIGLLAENSQNSMIYLYAYGHTNISAVLLNKTDHFTISLGHYYDNMVSILLYDTTATNILGNRFYNDGTSIYGAGAYETYVTNNQFQWSEIGAQFSQSLTRNSSYVDIHNNKITDCMTGIKFNGVDHGLFYNNYLNNSENFAGENLSKTYAYLYPTKSATNIVGCPGIGGNVWAAPDGTGFSEGCLDTNADCFCDSPYIDVISDERPLALNFGFGISVKLESINGAPFSDYKDYEQKKYVAATNSNNPTVSFIVSAAYKDTFTCSASWAEGSTLSMVSGITVQSNTPSSFNIPYIPEGCYDLLMNCTSVNYGSYVSGISNSVYFCVDQHTPSMDTSEFMEKGYVANPWSWSELNKSAFIIDMSVNDSVNTFALQCVLHIKNLSDGNGNGNVAHVSFDPTTLNDGRKTCWLKVSRNGTFDNFYIINGTYKYWVEAFDAAGNSISSDERIIEIDAPYLESTCVACENIGNSTISVIVPIEDTSGNQHYYYVYLYSENSTSMLREPITGAPILVWVKNATDKALYKIVTDSNGMAVLDYGGFLVPGGKEITFAYCCYLEGCDFDLCMNGIGIDQDYRDENQIFDVYSIPDAPNTLQPEIDRAQKYYLPSSEKVTVFPESTIGLKLSEQFCTPLAFLFGLLLATLYATGRNPFGFIDISPLRTGKHIKYTPRGVAKGGLQNISAMTVYGAAIRHAGVDMSGRNKSSSPWKEVKETAKAEWSSFADPWKMLASAVTGRGEKGAKLSASQRVKLVSHAVFGKAATKDKKGTAQVSPELAKVGITSGGSTQGLIGIAGFFSGGKKGVKMVAGVAVVARAVQSINSALEKADDEKKAKDDRERKVDRIEAQKRLDEEKASKENEVKTAREAAKKDKDVLTELGKKKEEIKAKIKEAKKGADVSELKRQLADINAELDTAQKNADASSQKVAELEKSLAELKKASLEVAAIKIRQEKISNDLKNGTNLYNLNKLKKDLDKTKADLAKAKKDLANLSVGTKEYEKKKTEVEKLMQTKSLLAEQIATTPIEVSALKEKFNVAQEALKKLTPGTEEYKKKETEISILKGQLETATEAAKKKLSSLEKEMAYVEKRDAANKMILEAFNDATKKEAAVKAGLEYTQAFRDFTAAKEEADSAEYASRATSKTYLNFARDFMLSFSGLDGFKDLRNSISALSKVNAARKDAIEEYAKANPEDFAKGQISTLRINLMASKNLDKILEGESNEEIKQLAIHFNKTFNEAFTSLNQRDREYVGKLVIGYEKSLKFTEEALGIKDGSFQKISEALNKPDVDEATVNASAKALKKILKSMPDIEKRISEEMKKHLENLKENPEVRAEYAKRVTLQVPTILDIVQKDESISDKERYEHIVDEINKAAMNGDYKHVLKASEKLNYELTGDNVPVKLPEYESYVQDYALTNDEKYQNLSNQMAAISSFNNLSNEALYHHDAISVYEDELQKQMPAVPNTLSESYHKIQTAAETHVKNMQQLKNGGNYGSIKLDVTSSNEINAVVTEYENRLSNFKKELETNYSDIERLEAKLKSAPQEEITNEDRFRYQNFSKWMTQHTVTLANPDLYIPIIYHQGEYQNALAHSFTQYQEVALRQYYKDVEPLSAYDFNLKPETLIKPTKVVTHGRANIKTIHRRPNTLNQFQ